jgi:hypothetical protein
MEKVIVAAVFAEEPLSQNWDGIKSKGPKLIGNTVIDRNGFDRQLLGEKKPKMLMVVLIFRPSRQQTLIIGPQFRKYSLRLKARDFHDPRWGH